MIAGVYCITGIKIETKAVHEIEYVLCLASSKSEAERTKKMLNDSPMCSNQYEKLKVRPYKERYVPADLCLPLKQYQHFFRMFLALNSIAKEFSTPSQLKRSSESEYGLDYESTLEMSYENIQEEAKRAIKGFRLKDLQSLIEIYKSYENKDGK